MPGIPAHTSPYTEDDYYSLPETIRSELIEGRFYDMSNPSRLHQEILMELSGTIRNSVRSKNGSIICGPGKLTGHGCDGAPGT